MSLLFAKPFASIVEATTASAGSQNDNVPNGAHDTAPPSSGQPHHQPLAVAVRARKSDYTRPRRIRVKIGSWNVGSLEGTEKDLAKWFRAPDDSAQVIPSGNEPGADNDHNDEQSKSIDHSKIDLYVLGLQEVVDVTSPTEALLRPYSDPATSTKWKGAAGDALPSGYKCIGEQQLVGLLLLIYASPELAPEISSVSTSAVGTGLGNNLTGYLGNKGGVAIRLLMGESTRMVFVNCHLAAGHDKQNLERRNWDAGMITSRTRFDAALEAGDNDKGAKEKIGDENFIWWFGDLNYRLDDIPDADVRRLLEIHKPKEFAEPKDKKDAVDSPYLESSPDMRSIKGERIVAESSVMSDDDPEAEERGLSSLQMTLSSLLSHDSLRKQQASRKAFHDGWKEAPITFLPTYKYDAGTVSTYDSSEKKRSPSWCDRILFRSKKDLIKYQTALQNEKSARAKDAEMKARGTDKAGEEEDVLFSYDPETDGLDYGDDDYDYDDDAPELANESTTADVSEEDLQVETYTSHQLITSSDHKPLSAVFDVTYDSVDRDLKAQVQQEVARELDRTENETRPVVTVVIDKEGEQGGIDFGEVRYGQKQINGATVANTGQVPAVVNFISRPSAKSFGNEYSHNWLKASFEKLNDETPSNVDAKEITLEPGDAVNISIELLVEDLTWVHTFNENPDLLEDVLVLGVKDGRDWFVSIRGKWMASILCRSIDELVKCPEGGVRKLQKAQAEGTIADFVKSEPKRAIPKEIYRLTDTISAEIEKEVADWAMRTSESQRDSMDLQHVQMQDMEQRPPWESSAEWPFSQPSWMFGNSPSLDLMCLTIREAIETDTEFKFSEEAVRLERIEAMGSTLVKFLSSLSDGIITRDVWETLDTAILAREKSKTAMDARTEKEWILDTLSTASPTHNICFVFLVNLLSTVAGELAPVAGHIQEAEAERRLAAAADKNKGASTPEDPAVLRRKVVDSAFAGIFGDLMINYSSTGNKKGAQARRQRVLELFLHGKWDGSDVL